MLNILNSSVRHRIRNILYPGLDLHTRNRASLCRFWKTGPRKVLDAGSGNGYFSWLAYQTGARVLAINFEQQQVEKAQKFLIEHKRADPARLQFERRNLYDLTRETRTFDESNLLRSFGAFAPGSGCGHRVLSAFCALAAPCIFAVRIDCIPRHRAEVLDTKESGGHVRAGYTEEDYRNLLEPIGFQIQSVVGIGTPAVYHADRVLRAIRNRFGDWAALPLLPIALPTVWFASLNPRMPFSLYVKAIKPVCGP